MKPKFTLPLLALLVSLPPGLAAESDTSGYMRESRLIARTFMQRLGGTLKNQLETADPASAIEVCKHIAPALATEYSRDGWRVSRVSLKARNKTLGTPDAWEREGLEKFDRQSAQEPATLEVSEVIEDADGHWFRYLKAIPTQPMCLQCHGKPDDLAAAVSETLTTDYPEDQALGYRAGDIRGAVSIKRKLADATEKP